jgi:hypothetical protein
LIAFSDNAPSRAGAPVIASVSPEIRSAHVSTAAFHAQPVRIVPASLQIHPARPDVATYRRHFSTKVTTKRVSHTNIYLASGTTAPSAPAFTPVAFTQTFLVVIESSQNGAPDQPMYQVQFWRMTVFHPAVDLNSKIPRKEI